MNEQLREYFAEIICDDVICNDDKCACLVNGNSCMFYEMSGYELAKIARDRYIKKGCPLKLAESIDAINAAYPLRAVIL